MNLVFASGFLFPQQILITNYFKDLDGHIGSRHEKLFPDVPVVAGYEARAQALADQIHHKFPVGPIHIIAHSMGGLDSRFLIGNNINGLATPGRIASLTTMATPHAGSPVADLLSGDKPDDWQGPFYEGIRRLLDPLIATGALKDLTRDRALKLPKVTQSHPHIRYRSHAAAGRPTSLFPTSGQSLLPTSGLLFGPHEYVRRKTGQENDGVVAVDSARYGDFQEPFWACDHADIVGHNLDGFGFRFDHFARFDAIIGQLEAEGQAAGGK